jgi:hypothetical protein
MDEATLLQKIGAGGFGALIGWYVYYINRHRKAGVSVTDLVTLIGVIGGSAILGLFPARGDLFGAYGIGLAGGFFLYFLVMTVLVALSKNFTADWFLDGRRKKLATNEYIPGADDPQPTPMGHVGTTTDQGGGRPDFGHQG